MFNYQLVVLKRPVPMKRLFRHSVIWLTTEEKQQLDQNTPLHVVSWVERPLGSGENTKVLCLRIFDAWLSPKKIPLIDHLKTWKLSWRTSWTMKNTNRPTGFPEISPYQAIVSHPFWAFQAVTSVETCRDPWRPRVSWGQNLGQQQQRPVVGPGEMPHGGAQRRGQERCSWDVPGATHWFGAKALEGLTVWPNWPPGRVAAWPHGLVEWCKS